MKVGRESYPDMIGRYWGEEELVVLEDDKVPTMADFDELITCAREACIFPYPFSYRKTTTIEDWLPPTRFPYGMGFVRFSLRVQQGVPYADWPRHFRNNECDKIIEVPLIAKYGPMHIHPKMIAHNHPPKTREVVGDKILGIVPGHRLPMPRFAQRFR